MLEVWKVHSHLSMSNFKAQARRVWGYAGQSSNMPIDPHAWFQVEDGLTHKWMVPPPMRKKNYWHITKYIVIFLLGVWLSFRPRQGRVKGNGVIFPCLPLPYTYLTVMAPVYLYFNLVGPHRPSPFAPLMGNSHFNRYNTLYLRITLYHTIY